MFRIIIEHYKNVAREPYQILKNKTLQRIIKDYFGIVIENVDRIEINQAITRKTNRSES